MATRITARFFDVQRHRNEDPRLWDVLTGIGAIGAISDREANVDEVRARLERLDQDGENVLAGEVTRLQTENFPVSVLPDGTEELDVDTLGHGIAFRFNRATGVLAIQYDVRLLSPSRFMGYLYAKWDGASYRLTPKVRTDSWDRFNEGPTKKLEIRIASPATLVDVAGAGESAANALRNMGEAYEAPYITIEMGVGGRGGSLSQAVKGLARQFFERHARGEIDVRGMKATAETGAGVPNDQINLLDELLSVKQSLDLPPKNHDRNYQIRASFLKTAMEENA